VRLFILKQFAGRFGELGVPILCVAVTHEVALNRTCLELFARLFEWMADGEYQGQWDWESKRMYVRHPHLTAGYFSSSVCTDYPIWRVPIQTSETVNAVELLGLNRLLTKALRTQHSKRRGKRTKIHAPEWHSNPWSQFSSGRIRCSTCLVIGSVYVCISINVIDAIGGAV
jgi:hypothetical protein